MHPLAFRPRRTPSAAQIAASRANGAKSHGPVTPEGKQNSSFNALKQGGRAKTIALNGEAPERLLALGQHYNEVYQPTNIAEAILVEEMALAKWRQCRLRIYESALLDYALDEIRPELETKYSSIDNETRLALAFRSLADQSHSLAEIRAHDAHFARQYGRALQQLLAGRYAQALLEPKDEIPSNEPENSLETLDSTSGLPPNEPDSKTAL